MATNEYLLYADSAPTANILTQAQYASDNDRTSGSGTTTMAIRKELENKFRHQVSKISVVVAQFIADKSGANVLDADTVATIENNLNTAIINSISTAGFATQSWTNTNFYTQAQVNGLTHSATSKTTPVNADELSLWDSVTSGLQKLTWANLIATVNTYIATIYAPLDSPTFTGTPSLPTGTTAVTQTAGDNSTKLATTAFTLANSLRDTGHSFSANGYQQLSNGLIIQWGLVTIGEQGVAQSHSWTFPTTFPTTLMNVQGIAYSPADNESATSISIGTYSTSACTFFSREITGIAQGPSQSTMFFAIGY